MTAVANTIFTAAQFNTYVRDNLNETAPAKASAAGQYFVSTGTNVIATRQAFGFNVSTAESTTSTSYTDLATVGPSVSVNCGPKAIVLVTSGILSDTANAAAFAGYDISGATIRAASDAEAVELDGVAANNTMRMGIVSMATGLTTGLNTFTMKYRVGSNTATFSNRTLAVIPF
jgi:hypothetical protein